MSTVSHDISVRCTNQGFLCQYGAMTVAAAPDVRSFAARSSNNSQGGGELHQFFPFLHSASGMWRESTTSAVPSRHLAL